jgi:outer membrane protein OmpA-like peptidoglycan-associated protein
MKKPLLFAVILLISWQISNSQLRIAIAGGVHSSNIIETNDLPNWSEIKSGYSSRTGAHFGFIADLQLGVNSKFYAQPGVMFYNKGRKFFSTYDTTVYNYISIDSKQFINYVDVPLNLVYKIPLNSKTKFFLGGGPYLSFFYNGLEKTETYLKTGKFQIDENEDLPVGDGPGKYKTFDLGVNGTAGIEFKGFFIAANYSHGITDMYTATYSGSFKNQVIGATIGVFIGKPISLEDAPKDTDNDGIVDKEDSCVTEPGPLVTKGCPDTDGDGIADRDDRCPNEKGLVSNFGCPLKDTDGDGITDDIDKCITVPGVAKYEGCPIPDTDNDGINDEDDKCTTVPGVARYNGCPIPDTDGDGVNDEEDKCVNEPGLKENSGCPEIKKEIIQQVEYAARKVQFTFGKAALLPASENVLDEIADLLLKQPELKLDIEGHTSSDGNLNANMKLSNERAGTVKNYLVKKGVDSSRLTSQGFGPTKPLNEGKTEAERALNRRVELKLRNN